MSTNTTTEDLRITAVETFRVSDRFLLVKVSTDAGIAGWGEPILESRAETVEAAVRELADLLIGEPVQIGRLWQRMHKSGFYRGGPILGSAVAGLDQALWDVLGTALGCRCTCCSAARYGTSSPYTPPRTVPMTPPWWIAPTSSPRPATG
ncbi:hypothetical protein [Ruania alba]|uniref:hypothetical protein n=1 Tax=Ruania alba TaxID=648782 RepID=UPI000B045B50|nr:hypothetical protein [Ruania alba]